MKNHVFNSPKRLILLLCSLTLLLSACEDKVNINVPKGETLVVVDGWITNQPPPYIISLTTTAPYFENKNTPKIEGATLIIKDSKGIIDTLIEISAGKYQTTKIIGTIGNSYTLEIINALGENYIAHTNMERGSVIDSITYKFKNKGPSNEEGYYVQYFGPEPIGVGDYYRFLITLNNQLLNQPSDAWMISSDELVDGNYIQEWEPYQKPLKKGDKIKFQTLSITKDSYYFFTELATQVNNGGIFANPSANLRSNIINTNPSSNKKGLGYFGASAVSEKEIMIQ